MVFLIKESAEAVGILLSFAAPIAVCIYGCRVMDERSFKASGEWHEHGDQMRRWRGDRWAYRPMSQADIDASVQKQLDEAW